MQNIYSSKGFPCVGSSLNRFLHSTRSLENLSSGENLAGWADMVGEPSGANFCGSQMGSFSFMAANSYETSTQNSQIAVDCVVLTSRV